jgi:protein phosphatase
VRRLGAVAAVLALLAAAAAAGAFFLSTLFFIGVDDGRLAIYSGVPVELGPIPLHAVYRRSVVTYDSLSPAARTLVDEQRLRDRSNAFGVSDQLGMWP